MTYFDELLEKGDRKSRKLPLWKLKITEEEYLGLILCLRQRVINRSLNCNNPFMANTKECALFYAEYWRREYSGEGHSKKEAFKKLGLQEQFNRYCNDFHEAAIEGAKQLHIEIYDEKRNEWLDSMFYQGGLPMKLVTEGRETSVWNRFARGLVCRRKNFDELGLGVIGENSRSLNEFCDYIIDALDAEDIEKMPFKCDENTYKYLQELKTRERHHQKMAHPFSLDWEFRIDAVEKKIYTSYVVKGPQRLPQDFFDVNVNNIDNPNFFSILVQNGNEVTPFDYANNFCRYNVEYKDAYHPGDVISVSIDDNTTPIISDDLDMDTPHLMYRNNEGMYELGNRIGRQESFLLIPEGWNAKDMHGLCMDSYEYEGTQYGGIMIPANFKEEITIRNGGDMLTFGCNIPLYWTELSSLPEDTPNITESLYDADKAHFALCSDMENGVRKNTNAHIEYRSKWDKGWKAEPGYGEIFARAKDNNGHFVTPVKFINIGNGVRVKVVDAKEDSCKIKVTWEHGHVIAADNIRQVNGEWVVNKEDITNSNIRFTLVPEDNSNNQFLIHVKAPFKKFAILDTNDNAIDSESWIPYSEIDRFQYHLIGQNIRYTYGGHQRVLKWIDGELCIMENLGFIKKTIKRIPYEGCLVSLFDSREELRLLMGYTSRDITGAEVKVTLRTQDGQFMKFAIKDSPYRVVQKEDGSMCIKDTKEIDYKGSLKLFKLDDPNAETKVTLEYDQEKGYRLPETIASWGKTLVTGSSRGTILPALMDTTHILTKEERTAIREETIRQISEELEGAHLGDKLWQRIMGWFNLAQKEAIPASSLLELCCVGKSPKALICLAFLLYAKTGKESLDTLTEQMKALGADLAFSWYWLMPHLKSALSTISDFINGNFNDPYISLICTIWAMTKGDKTMEYFNIIGNPSHAEHEEVVSLCLMETIESFDTWIKELCVDSLVETYDCHTDNYAVSTARDIVCSRDNLVNIDMQHLGYVDVSQDFINEETASFFRAYTNTHTSVNENWLMERVKVVKAHLIGEVDLFAQSDEIRRSIIFCSKSYNRQFIINLNNQLA